MGSFIFYSKHSNIRLSKLKLTFTVLYNKTWMNCHWENCVKNKKINILDFCPSETGVRFIILLKQSLNMWSNSFNGIRQWRTVIFHIIEVILATVPTICMVRISRLWFRDGETQQEMLNCWSLGNRDGSLRYQGG